MKYLALVPLILVASCASRPQLVLRSIPSPAVEPLDAVRYSEVVRAYQLGRYVDANHPETLHEQHPLYRIEASAHWNLHPGSAIIPLNPRAEAVFAPPPMDDVLVAEMNRQREATSMVMQEAARLAQSFAGLQAVITQMQNVARTHVAMSARLATAEDRLIQFGKELQTLSPPPLPRTNEVPLLTPETPEAPKP